MKYKYAYVSDRIKGQCTQSGRTVNPDLWVTGPDPLRREKYYAYLKHKAQRKFRKEQYNLTWEAWERIWPDDLFLKRGRGKHSLCLMLVDLEQPWDEHNVEVVTRLEQLARNREYRK